jgi:hypothetical protein
MFDESDTGCRDGGDEIEVVDYFDDSFHISESYPPRAVANVSLHVGLTLLCATILDASGESLGEGTPSCYERQHSRDQSSRSREHA